MIDFVYKKWYDKYIKFKYKKLINMIWILNNINIYL